MTIPAQPKVFQEGEIGIFIGHADDAAEEAKAVYGLERALARELEGFRKVNQAVRYTSVRFWEWTEDASCEVGGQARVIDPAIDRASIAVFVFKDRIGKVTWKELERYRTLPRPRWAIALFPKAPSDLSKLSDSDYMGNWSELLNGKKTLTRDWNDENSTAVRNLIYENAEHLKQIAFDKLKAALIDILSRDRDGPDRGESADISAYLAWINEKCGQMDLRRLASQPIIAGLPDLFVPLYAEDPERPRGGKGAPSGTAAEMDAGRSPVDIEELIARNDYLLIEGEPGSGKTTLLKRVALAMAQRFGEKDFCLPVLVFLRDLKEILDTAAAGISGAEKILELYFAKHEKVLSCAAIAAYCKEKRAIFLIDGLDEIAPEPRNRIVEAFADFRVKHGARMALSGRKQGIEGEAMERFGKKHVTVLPFNAGQIENYIGKWCELVYVRSPAEGKKTAREMSAEIRGHKALNDLIRNPLMLTTVCILYYEGEKLPDQRAELYRKFVENLAHRRFPNPDKILDVLKGLAFAMQQSGDKGIDRCDALKIAGSVFIKEKDEPEERYRKRVEAEFDTLEPRCGLLKLEDGHYRFWHLSFQEYLTAEYLISTKPEPVQAIEPFLADARNREVVKLYIGCLSINQRKVAATIVQNILRDHAATAERLMLAGEALADIKKERRDDSAVALARERFGAEINKHDSRKVKAGFGELIGWLGDERDLKEFAKVKGGLYKLEGLGEKRLEPFEIGKYPVTNAWYREFIDDGGYDRDPLWTEQGRIWKRANKIEAPKFWGEKGWCCPNAPVVGVSWWEAKAFVNWLNETRFNAATTYRLPSEEEWQAAAAGFEGRRFPWGNEFDAQRCNYREGEGQVGKTSMVGIFKQGNTPDGIADMAGNVWEWCGTEYRGRGKPADFPYDQEVQNLIDKEEWLKVFGLHEKKGFSIPVLRGGSWVSLQTSLRCAFRGRSNPYDRLNVVGFRCVR